MTHDVAACMVAFGAFAVTQAMLYRQLLKRVRLLERVLVKTALVQVMLARLGLRP